MKKLLFIALLTLTSLAAAEVPTYRLSSCEDVVFSNTLGYPRLDWRVEAKFPDPSISLSSLAGIDIRDFIVTCPGQVFQRTMTDNSVGKWVIKFDNPEVMIKTLYGSFVASDLMLDYWYDYPSIREGFHSEDVKINPAGRIMNKFVNVKKGSAAPSRFSNSVIGFKKNNGPLTPLLYNGKFMEEMVEPSGKVEFWSQVTLNAEVRYYQYDYDKLIYVYDQLKAFPRN